MKMMELSTRNMNLTPTGNKTKGQRESKPKKADDLLIEEILKAAGLEALD